MIPMYGVASVSASVEGETIPAPSGAVAALRREGGSNELLLNRSSNIALRINASRISASDTPECQVASNGVKSRLSKRSVVKLHPMLSTPLQSLCRVHHT